MNRRRGAAFTLQIETCESRRALAAVSLVPAAGSGIAAETWTPQSEAPALGTTETGTADAAGDVLAITSSVVTTLNDFGETVFGTVVDGRLVTGRRAYGFQPAPDVASFDVDFEINGLAEGSQVWFEFMQGVTFWNGRGATPRFQRSQQPVELNFGNDTADVRIGAVKNVGSFLDVGVAEPGPGGSIVSEQFVVTAGIGGSGGSFSRRAANGVYAVVGRLVGDGVESSQPVTFLFEVGTVPAGAFEAAVQSFRTSPPVSVFDVQTPESGFYGAGRAIQVTYQFSDPVTVTGAPRMPLTLSAPAPLNRQQRFATYDAAASTPTRVVFSYVVQPADGFSRSGVNQAFVQTRTGQLQLPRGSAIRGADGGIVFPTVTNPVNFNDVIVRSLRVIGVENNTPAGNYREGAVLAFGLEMSAWINNDVVGGTPTIPIRAIGGGIIGQAVFTPNGFPPFETNYMPFRFTVPAGVVARRGIVVAGPISLNGGRIVDSSGNEALLTFTALNVGNVRIVPA